MWKMKHLKSIEFYRKDNLFRVSLLQRTDGRQIIEITSPAVDVPPARLAALTNMDYHLILDMMGRAVQPDEIHQHIEKGWE